jgi:hypothetical protein
MGPIARKVGADMVVMGDVGSLSGVYVIYLKLVGANGSTIRTANGMLDPGADGLRAAAKALVYQLLLPDRYSGTIVVQVDVANAWIYLNGRRMARSPSGRLAQVPVGKHALRVTHEAYRDFVQFVRVGFNETVRVPVTLSAYPIAEGEMKLVNDGKPAPLKDSELPWYRRWWAVATFGAVILAATTTSVAYLAGRSVSRDAEVVVQKPGREP